MKNIFAWIKRHQVAAFFIITYAITWGLGFSYDAVINKKADLLAPLVFYRHLRTCAGRDHRLRHL